MTSRALKAYEPVASAIIKGALSPCCGAMLEKVRDNVVAGVTARCVACRQVKAGYCPWCAQMMERVDFLCPDRVTVIDLYRCANRSCLGLHHNAR